MVSSVSFSKDVLHKRIKGEGIDGMEGEMLHPSFGVQIWPSFCRVSLSLLLSLLNFK
jgi:hypothetical protein